MKTLLIMAQNNGIPLNFPPLEKDCSLGCVMDCPDGYKLMPPLSHKSLFTGSNRGYRASFSWCKPIK